MPQLVIDSIEYNVPTDFTLGQWKELQKWSANENKILSIAFGFPLSSAERIPDKTKHLALSLIVATMYPQWKQINKEVNGGKLLNFDTIKLGQFIDLEVYVGRDYTKHINQIVELLYQAPVDDSWLIGDIWGGLESYFKWRITLYNAYKNLFGIQNDLLEEAEYSQDSKIDVAHVWYDTIMILADNKFLNIDAVMDKTLIEALNYLAWNKTRIEKEAELIRYNQAR
jgi:hypothetical protein